MDAEPNAEPVVDGLFRAWDGYLMRAPVGAGTAPLGGDDDHDGDHDGDGDAHAGLLTRAAADEHLREALTLASPSLAGLLDKVATRGAHTLKPAQRRRAALAVLRYDIRRRTRPTPFGLFAGVAGGRFGAAATPDGAGEAGAAGEPMTRTHVDMQWLLAVLRPLESAATRLPALRVQAHPALVVRGDRVVLDCASTFGAAPGTRSRTTVSVRRTAPLRRALELAARPVPLGDLVDDLAATFGAGAPVRALLDSLVSQEILLSELRPPLDGTDPLEHVLAVLEPTGEQELRAALRALDAQRRAYDRVPAGRGRAELDTAIGTARRMHEHPTPLHVDTRLPSATALPRAVADEVETAVELMWRMSTPKLGLWALRDYHARFLERYGADRLVPLLDLIDGNVGLGPPPGYGWPAAESDGGDPDPPRDRDRERVLHGLLAEALRTGSREVVLDEHTVRLLCRGTPAPAEVPNSCEVTVHVVAPSAGALDDGEFLVTLSPSPGSHHAGATATRFMGALGEHDDRLRAAQRELPTHVAGAMAANIAFLPRSGKAANLSHTVPGTGRRIGIGLGESAHAEELRLADLAVAATLERLCVVHEPTGREVTPVLANMVSATAQAPNAARLLWEIGLEGQRLWEPWKWGSLTDAPFVPRVRVGRFVLAPAVWRLDELRAHDGDGSADDWAPAVTRWRERHDVPRHVLVVSNDQRLSLDLDNAWHRELLREEIRKDAALTAQEIPGEAQGWLHSPLAGHTREFVVSLQRRDPTPRHAPTVAFRERRTPSGLGGDWIYLKLYGAARTQDELLRGRLSTLVDAARGHGADRWFFLRYTDPDGHHVRLRLHGDPAALWSAVAPALGGILAGWQRDGLLRAHRVDQYEPEFERYGGAGLARWVEELFQADSAAAIELLTLAADPGCPYSLDTLASLSVAGLAHAFGPPTGETGESGGAGEAGECWLSRTGTRRELPDAYRRDAAHWARLIDPAGGWAELRGDVFGDKVLAALRARDEAVATTRRRMDELRAEGACATDEGRFVGSLMHMSCNRLFGGDSSREREVVAMARGAAQDAAKRRRHTR